jgi:hypothetical protein
MVSANRDFYLRKKEDGTIAFRIKVPLQLREAVGRHELQMNLPAVDTQKLALELARCCQDHFNRISKVEPMVESFNQAEGPQDSQRAHAGHRGSVACRQALGYR